MKEGIIIISITQKEAFYLNKNEGIPYGADGISVTHSRHSGKTYRLCEAPKNLRLLENYRKSRIVEK